MRKSLNLAGLKDEQCLEISFMHGFCHYLALGMADEFGSKVALWLDYDEELQKDVLVHAFSVIGESFYFDAEGCFTDLSEREGYFEYNYEPNVSIMDREEAKKILRKLKIPYGDTKIKRFIREKLRSHYLVFQIKYKSDGIVREMAYKGESEFHYWEDKIKLILSQVDSNGYVAKYLDFMGLTEFKISQKIYYGVIPNS